MTVRLNERKKDERMEVQTLAEKLASYTFTEASKENVVPKRHRWSIGERLIGMALDVAAYIDIANDFNLDIPEEAEKRRAYQDEAIAKAYFLRALVFIAREQARFGDDKLVYWTGLADSVIELAKKWRDSDTRRKRDNAKKAQC